MVEVEIRGKKFPLCLTVAALDKINEKCGGLKNITAFLGVTDFSEASSNTAWMLGLLIAEGEENRIVCARFDGGDSKRRAVPDSDAVSHLLTPGNVLQYRGVVYEAINESMKQEITAEHAKNGENAEQR